MAEQRLGVLTVHQYASEALAGGVSAESGLMSGVRRFAAHGVWFRGRRLTQPPSSASPSPVASEPCIRRSGSHPVAERDPSPKSRYWMC